jgi:two-component system chemotaxis response regulator CheB
MGRDGTDGAIAARLHGGTVIAQDDATCAVYGMPRAVADAGAADRILPLGEIAVAIAEWAAANSHDREARRDPALLKTAVLADT